MKSLIAYSLALLPVLAVGDDNWHCGHDAPAIPREMYELILHAEKLGLTVDNADPDSLSFDSDSLPDCFQRAKSAYSIRDELAKAILACGARHPSKLECNEDK